MTCPRSRRAIPHTALSAIAAGLALTTALTACGASHPSRRTSSRVHAASPVSTSTSQPPLGYRSLPSYLPTASTPVDRVVTASVAHPQLAVQGVAVEVRTPSGSALATVTGPHVPPFVTPPPPSVTAVFDVSLARTSGTVPIRAADFTITDQLGRRFHPTQVAHEKPTPADAPHTRTVVFHLTAVMPTGEGRIYWAPAGKAEVAWDFIVEND